MRFNILPIRRLLVAWYKIVLAPLLTHWRYHSLELRFSVKTASLRRVHVGWLESHAWRFHGLLRRVHLLYSRYRSHGAAMEKDNYTVASKMAKISIHHTCYLWCKPWHVGIYKKSILWKKLTIVTGGGYSSSSRAGRLGRTLWPQNSTSVAETEKGGQNSTMTPPPNARKGGSIFYISMKSLQKRGSKIYNSEKYRVKILQVWKWGSKFYMLKNRGQNSTMLEKRGVNILHPTPKVEVKILHRLKKGGQKGRAYPLPKI